jgi:DNA-binding LacI/PurR family transcriptional regulator
MLKEVVAGGITTISTDFTEMGKMLANMVVTRDKSQVRNKARMIVRNSL